MLSANSWVKNTSYESCVSVSEHKRVENVREGAQHEIADSIKEDKLNHTMPCDSHRLRTNFGIMSPLKSVSKHKKEEQERSWNHVMKETCNKASMERYLRPFEGRRGRVGYPYLRRGLSSEDYHSFMEEESLIRFHRAQSYHELLSSAKSLNIEKSLRKNLGAIPLYPYRNCYNEDPRYLEIRAEELEARRAHREQYLRHSLYYSDPAVVSYGLLSEQAQRYNTFGKTSHPSGYNTGLLHCGIEDGKEYCDGGKHPDRAQGSSYLYHGAMETEARSHVTDKTPFMTATAPVLFRSLASTKGVEHDQSQILVVPAQSEEEQGIRKRSGYKSEEMKYVEALDESPDRPISRKVEKRKATSKSNQGVRKAEEKGTHQIDVQVMESTDIPQCHATNAIAGEDVKAKKEDTEDGKIVCTVCKKTFNRASNLYTHMRTHSSNKPHACEFCSKRFHQKADLRIHRYIHTGEKPHKCKKCGRAFKQLTHLKYHMRTHSDVRMYKCPYCDKGFNQKSNLQAHIFGHTGQRPHKCDVCGKGFTLASTLNTHKRTHLPSKPFKCTYCDKAFYQKNALKMHHMSTHPYSSGVCVA